MTEIDRNLRRKMLDAFKVRFYGRDHKKEAGDDALFAALKDVIAVRDAALEPVVYISQEDLDRMQYGFAYTVTVKAGEKGGGFNTALYDAPPILIERCNHGHRFAVTDGHPTRDGGNRCPHCMAVALDAARADLDLTRKALMWANRCNSVEVSIQEYQEAKGE